MPGAADDVARRIEPAFDNRKCRRAQHPAPERKLPHPPSFPCLLRKPVRPPPQRRATRRQRRHSTACKRPPHRRKISHQNAPRYPVNRQMMDAQQQTTRSSRTGIEPHRLHHYARRRRKPLLGRLRMFANAGTQRIRGQPRDIDAPQAAFRIDQPAGRDLDRKVSTLRARNKSQPQPVVMIEHRLQRPNQMILAQTRRHLQQHRLVEALDRPATFSQPVHDRRRRQAANGDVGHSRYRLIHEPSPPQPKPQRSDAQTPPAG